MDKDKIPPIIGAVLLVAGIVVMFFVFYQAMMMVSGVGNYFREQFPEEEGGEEQGPTAAFSWSANDLDVNFRDESEEGDANIRHWRWDFGDGESSNQQEPSHTFSSDGNWRVSLEVEDQNGKTDSVDTDVYVEWGRTDRGESERGDFGNIEIGFGNFLTPLAAALLVGILFMIMFLVGAAMVKAGWNLVKPGPSTLKLKIKPKKLEVENAQPEATYSTQPAPARNAVSTQPQPAYQPQPHPDAVIASMRALSENRAYSQQPSQNSYSQDNYYPQHHVGSYQASPQPVSDTPNPPPSPTPRRQPEGLPELQENSPTHTDESIRDDPNQTNLMAFSSKTPEPPAAENKPPENAPPPNTALEKIEPRETPKEPPSSHPVPPPQPQAQAPPQQKPPYNPPPSNQKYQGTPQGHQQRPSGQPSGHNYQRQAPNTRETKKGRGRKKGKGRKR